MSSVKRRRVPPGTYFWVLVVMSVLALLVGFINALLYKGDTRQMLGGRAATNQLSK